MFYIPPTPREQLNEKIQQVDKKSAIFKRRVYVSFGMSTIGAVAVFYNNKYGTFEDYSKFLPSALTANAYYAVSAIFNSMKATKLKKQASELDESEAQLSNPVNAWQRSTANQPTLKVPDPYRAISPLAVPTIKFIGNHIGEHGGIIAQTFGPDNMERISSRREAKTEYQLRTTRIERARDTIGMLSGQFQEVNSYNSGVASQNLPDSSQPTTD